MSCELMNLCICRARDVYAFGLLMWEMLEYSRTGQGVRAMGRRLDGRVEDETPQKWLQRFTSDVIDGGRPDIEQFPESVQGLLSQCWHSNPGNRPSATVIRNTMYTIRQDVVNIARNGDKGNVEEEVPINIEELSIRRED